MLLLLLELLLLLLLLLQQEGPLAAAGVSGVPFCEVYVQVGSYTPHFFVFVFFFNSILSSSACRKT